jgi:hypothetical protein
MLKFQVLVLDWFCQAGYLSTTLDLLLFVQFFPDDPVEPFLSGYFIAAEGLGKRRIVAG